MRLLYITAGAGGMYCGSCIRDNALAAALMARGHDVTLVPMYTPTRPDEANVSHGRVFFGGVSVYLQQKLSLFQHTPWLLDRLWDAPWLLRAVSGRGIETQPDHLGPLTVSMLRGADGNQRKELEKLLHWLRDQPKPEIVDISNSMLIALARPIKTAIGCPVCCTLQGEDIFLGALREPYRSQAFELVRAAVPFVDRFIAVSDYYAAHMSRLLAIPGAKIDVVPLGINLTGLEPAVRQGSHGFTIGYFGRIAPEKGVHLLCEAYRRLRHGNTRESNRLRQGYGGPPKLHATAEDSRRQPTECRLEMAGYLGPEHKQYFDSLLRQVREWGVEDGVQYRGELDRQQKIDFLRSLDVLAVPAAYDDPKGLPLVEAMACAVPVVATRRGTYTEILERTGGGILVAPDDINGLVDALHRLRDDEDLRRELGRRGATAVREHYSASAMAERALEVYRAAQRRAA